MLRSCGSLRIVQFKTDKKVGVTQPGVMDHSFGYCAPLDAWVHLAWVATPEELTLYADAAPVGKLRKAIALFPQRIGARTGNTFKGRLDDIRIYTRALRPEEIVQLSKLGSRP
jgi:hypothetical protein